MSVLFFHVAFASSAHRSMCRSICSHLSIPHFLRHDSAAAAAGRAQRAEEADEWRCANLRCVKRRLSLLRWGDTRRWLDAVTSSDSRTGIEKRVTKSVSDVRMRVALVLCSGRWPSSRTGRHPAQLIHLLAASGAIEGASASGRSSPWKFDPAKSLPPSFLRPAGWAGGGGGSCARSPSPACLSHPSFPCPRTHRCRE